MLIRRIIVATLCFGPMMLGAGGVHGQAYPTKPIRLLVSAPGGGTDVLARIITPGLSENLGQQVVVDNRGSSVQVDAVYKSWPDGYSLMMIGTFPNWIITLLRNNPNDRSISRDFSPISIVGRVPQVLVVNPSVPAKSVKELVALAKAKPGSLNYASSSPGGTNSLAGELFKVLAGVNIVAIPYKGTGAGIVGLLGNEVQMMIPAASAVVPLVKSGKLRALAVTSAQPSEFFPGLPTMAASGLPGYEMEQTLGMFAPRKTPVAIISRLNQAIVRVVSQADVKAKFFSSGSEAVGSSPAELAAKVKAEMVRWGKVIKDAGIRAEPK